MYRMTRGALAAAVWTIMVGGCEQIVDGGAESVGLHFDYSGAMAGSFVSSGIAAIPGNGIPPMQTFAMAQRDSIGGLLLGSFRRTGEGRGDLFILQLRGTSAGGYTCGGVAGVPSCYGHLYVGVDAGSGTATAETIYGISGGEVVLTEVRPTRATGTFGLTLHDLEDDEAVLTIMEGTLDVPVVEGVFTSSFGCFIKRLEEGPTAACD